MTRKNKKYNYEEKGKFIHLADYAEKANHGDMLLRKIVAQVWNLYEKKKKKKTR